MKAGNIQQRVQGWWALLRIVTRAVARLDVDDRLRVVQYAVEIDKGGAA